METNIILQTERNATIQKWSKTISDFKNSGMQLDEFCSSAGITKNQYYYWRRIVLEAAASYVSPEFVDVSQVRDDVNAHNVSATISINGKRIDLYDSASSLFMERLLKAVSYA